MNQAVADWIIVGGGLTAFVGAQGAGIVTLRYMLAGRASRQDPTKRRVIVLEGVKSMLRFAMVAAVGVFAIVLALVFGYSAAAWTLAIPAILLVGIPVATWLAHRRLGQLGSPAS